MTPVEARKKENEKAVSEEIFWTRTVRFTDPITYYLNDLSEAKLDYGFYEQELLRADQQVYRIDKVTKIFKDIVLIIICA